MQHLDTNLLCCLYIQRLDCFISVFQILLSSTLFFFIKGFTLPQVSPTHIVDLQTFKDSNSTIIMEGKCGFNFSIEDSNEASHKFDDFHKDDTFYSAFIFLEQKKSDSKSFESFLSDDKERNGLQEWIWLETHARYETINLPMDFVALTFTISEYGTRPLNIPWMMSESCEGENKISYPNETKRIVTYLVDNIIGNISNSYLCHRTSDNTSSSAMIIWWMTTIWIGYDWNCYFVGEVMEGKFEIQTFSKYDITKILTVSLGILAYMYPFFSVVVEGIQPNPKNELYCYYKKEVKLAKPYSLSRFLQKYFFGSWTDLGVCRYFQKISIGSWKSIQTREKNHIKYAPIAYYYGTVAIIIFSLSAYKFLNIGNEYWKRSDEYVRFPHDYRFGVPEYQGITYHSTLSGWSFQASIWIPLVLSFFTFIVLNVWIYYMLNENDDYIVCFSSDNSKQLYLVSEIMDSYHDDRSCNWLLNASKMLVLRFTMLLSSRFWIFILKQSFYSNSRRCCSNCMGNNDVYTEVSDGKCTCRKCVTCFLCSFIFGSFLFLLNALMNIIFCSLPVIWFIFYMPIAYVKKDYTRKWKCLFIILFLMCYLPTIREHVGVFEYMFRSIFYLIIAAFTISEHVWRVNLVVLFSLGYFVSYFSEFIHSYHILLNVIFEIQSTTRQRNGALSENRDPDRVDEDLFNHIVDHCYSVHKRVFMLVLKTTLTAVFMIVTLIILRKTGRFDNSEYLTDTLSILFILLSPKVVSVFAENDSEDEIEKYKEDIETLYWNFYCKTEARADDDTFVQIYLRND